jgi:8-oxo-dGTP diphosphatase
MIKCTFENGIENSLRHVTVDALIIKEGQILLVKRSQVLIEPRKFALPGGYLERDESGPEAIIREVKEETGFLGSVNQLFRIITKPRMVGDDRQNVSFVYLIDIGERIGESDHEIESLQWFTLDNLPHPDQIAFDHHDTITLFLKHRLTQHPIPIID